MVATTIERTAVERITIPLDIPVGMKVYLEDQDPSESLARDAMLLYPYIQDLTISHGRAAEILGMNKLDLIDYYCSIGIPYLDQSKMELEEEVQEYKQFARESM